MKNRIKSLIIRLACVLVVFHIVAYSGGIVPTKQDPNNPQYVPNEVLVKFKDGVTFPKVLAKGATKTGISAIDKIGEEYQIEKMVKVFKDAKSHLTKPVFKDYQGNVHEVPNLDKIYKITYKSKTDPKELSKTYSEDPTVEYAEPNYIAQICAQPNDPDFGKQWGLHNTGQYILEDADVDAPEAWEIEKGDTAIIIGIIDTGVDYDHPDLMDKVVGKGYDFVNDDEDAMDDNGHGTHVAGIAAATTDNGIGIAGVASNCKILPVKVLQSNGYGTYSDVSNGVIYAAENGAKVINISLGGYYESYIMRDALENAYTTAMVVAAAGNDKTDIPFYPAAWSFVIGVGATDVFQEETIQGDSIVIKKWEGRALFSNYGINADLYAPGVGIYSSAPQFHPLRHSYASWTGTSMAAPFVSGAAALLRTKCPDWSNDMIKGQLVHTTDPIVKAERLNIYKAFVTTEHPNLNLYSFSILDTLPGCDHDRIADAGETVAITFDIQNTWGQAYNIQAVLRPHSYEDICFVTILDSTATFGGGVSAYAHVNNESNPFTFYVKPGTPNNTDVYFDYEIICDNLNTFVGNFRITIQKGTQLSGIIRSDLTLTNEFEYLVVNNVLVESGVTLRIEPGVKMSFNKDKYLKIEGELVAIADNDKKIVFTSNNPGPKKGDWKGIIVRGSSLAQFDSLGQYLYGSIIKNCVIEYSSAGIDLCYSSISVIDNILQENLNGIYLNNNERLFTSVTNSVINGNSFINNTTGISLEYCFGSPIISNNLFIGNYQALRHMNSYGTTTIFDVLFEKNFIVGSNKSIFFSGGIFRKNIVSNTLSDYAIYFDRSRTDCYQNTILNNDKGVIIGNFGKWDGTANIYNNNILNNHNLNKNKYEIYVSNYSLNVSNINAYGNYWNTQNVDSIDQWLWDYYDDFDSRKLLYQPIEVFPIAFAPGFLYQLNLNTPSPIGCETDTFTLIFSKPMDISTQPTVKFGVTDPYTQHDISGGWIDSTRWQGAYTFGLTTGDGINLRFTPKTGEVA